MKYIKYLINELVSNKIRLFLLFLMFLIVSYTSYSTIFVITKYSSELLEETFVQKDYNVIQNVNLRPENYEPLEASSYVKFFRELNLKAYTYIDSPMINSNEEKFMKNDKINGIIASKELLKGYDISEFYGPKVILPAEFEKDYKVGDYINFDNYYYTESETVLSKSTGFEIVGFYKEISFLNPYEQKEEKLNDKLIFAPINLKTYNFDSMEYDAIASEIILSSFLYLKTDKVDSTIKYLRTLANKYNINIRSNNITDARVAQKISIKNTIVNKILFFIPIYVMFVLGLNYVIKSILTKRIYFYAIISSLGADTKFIKALVFLLLMTIFSIAYMFLIIININMEIQNDLVSYFIVFILMIVVVVFSIVNELSILSIDNLKNALKGKND